MRSCVLAEVAAAATPKHIDFDVIAVEGFTTARGKDSAIAIAMITARVGGGRLDRDGCLGVEIAYRKQVRVVVGARSSRRATVAAMNFGLSPRTKAIYIRSVG